MTNKTFVDFDLALRAAIDLNQPEMQELRINTASGWLDGGGFCLAAALHEWADGHASSVGVLRGKSGIMAHAAVALEIAGVRMIADGNGVSDLEQFSQYWSHDKANPSVKAEPVTADRVRAEAFYDEVFDVDGLCLHLKATLGSPVEWGLRAIEAGHAAPRPADAGPGLGM